MARASHWPGTSLLNCSRVPMHLKLHWWETRLSCHWWSWHSLHALLVKIVCFASAGLHVGSRWLPCILQVLPPHVHPAIFRPTHFARHLVPIAGNCPFVQHRKDSNAFLRKVVCKVDALFLWSLPFVILHQWNIRQQYCVLAFTSVHFIKSCIGIIVPWFVQCAICCVPCIIYYIFWAM
jgi:hypothetical protein